MRKGRHRRHRDARDLKRGGVEVESNQEPCEECRRSPHADWCMADEDEEDDAE